MKRTIFGAFAVLFMVGCFTAASMAAEPIKLGALYNLTGGMSSIDAPSLNGAKLKAKLINESGGLLGGRMLEIIGIDTKTDQKATATGARKALSKGVVAGLGYGDTTFVMAAAPLFQAKGIPFVTSGATHPELPKWVGDCMFHKGPPAKSRLGKHFSAEYKSWLTSSARDPDWWYHDALVMDVNEIDWI